MSWNLPSNMMSLYGMQDDQGGGNDQSNSQDVYAKGREELYGGNQMGNMGGLSGGGMMGMLMGGMGYAKGGAVHDAMDVVREHLRRGGGPVGQMNFHPQFANDRDAMIRAVYAEAGNQGPQGQSMVAHNIMNRADANYGGYGNGVQDQILANKQYSSFNPNMPKTNVAGVQAMKLDPNGDTYNKIGNVVDNAMGRIEPDPTHGASHYYAPQGMPGGRAPKWANDPGMNFIGQEGAHKFYAQNGFNPQQPATPMQMGDQQALSNMQQANQTAMNVATRPDDFGAGSTMRLPPSIANAQPPAPTPNIPLPPTRPADFGGGNDLPSRGMSMGNDLPSRNDIPLPPTRPEMGPSMAGMSHPNMGPSVQEMAHPFMGPQMSDMTPPPAPSAPNAPDSPHHHAVEADTPDTPETPDMTDGLEHAWGSSDDLGDLGDIFDFRRGGAVSPFARGGRAGFGDGGEAQPGDRAHEVVNDLLHGDRERELYRESPMLQQYGDRTAASALDANTVRPSDNAHDFVQQALNKNEPQLPQYDRAAVDAMKEGSKEALHLAAYATPAAPAMAAYDAYEGMKSGNPYEAALGAAGLPGRGLKAAGMAASAMMPDEAQASGYGGRGSWEAALQAAKRMSEAAQRVYSGDRLLVSHSLDSGKMAQRLKDYDGSIIGPSLAVSKIDGVPTSFGDVTLVGRPHLAIPDEDTKMWRADAYTPRFPHLHPNPGYVPPEKMPLVEEYSRRFADSPNKYAMANAIMHEVEDRATRTGLINYFDKPERGGFKNLVYNTRDRLIGEGDLVPATPQNIIQNMLSGRIEGGEGNGGMHGLGLLKALAHPQVKTAEELQRERHLIAPDENANADDWADMYSRASAMGGLHAKHHRAPSNYPEHDFIQALTDYVRAGEAAGGGEQALMAHYPGADRGLLTTAVNYMGDLRRLPTSYYEAKAFRPVGLDEFAGAVVPSNRHVDDVVNSLADFGMDRSKIKLYREHDDAQRLQRIHDTFGDNFFADGGDVGFESSEKKDARLPALDQDEARDLNAIFNDVSAPKDRAQEYSPGRMQSGLTPDKFNDIMTRSTQQFMNNNDHQMPHNEPIGQLMDIDRSYQKPLNYNQEIDKLRQHGTSHVVDPEGREGNPVFVAGTAPDGTNIPLNQAQAAMIAHSISRLSANYDENNVRTRGMTTASKSQEAALPKGQTGQFITINNAPYEGDNKGLTVGHEAGHAMGRIMDMPVNAELKDANSKAIGDFQRLNAERTYMTPEQLYSNHPFSSKVHLNTNERDYYVSPSESWAESIGRYMQDPNDFKSKYPDAAKFLRDKVNTDPELNKLLMLSRNESRPVAQDGGRVEKGGGGSMISAALKAASRLGKLHPEGSGYIPKAGMPETVNIPGIGRVEARPIEDLEAAKNKLMAAQGRSTESPVLKPLNPLFSAKVADAFERMSHDPHDPLVKRSYDAMISNVMDQYNAAKDAGYDFHFLNKGEHDPYHLSPAQGYADLVNNRRLSVFPTDQGFGTLNKSADDNPLLRPVGRVGDKENAVANDAFRLVHDVNGHFGPGNPFFRAAGEERAYQLHAPTFDDAAIPALTAETRGQNSWVNYGPHGEANRAADGATTTYADQKIGRLPEWTQGDIDDYVRTLMHRADGGRTNAAEDTTAHDFDRQMLDSGEPQIPQHNDRFERGMSEMFGMPQAEAGEASAVAKALETVKKYGKQTVNEPQRNLFPGIYANPREIAQEAETRVAPESIALKRLFGVTRQDLYDIGKDRVGNADPELAFKAGARGSEPAQNVMTRRNATRLQDVLHEAGEQPGLSTGMDAWYVMDPLYQQMVRLYGPEKAAAQFNMLNHATGTMSPGSPVTTEMNRGLAAYYLQNQGRYDDFVKYGGNPAKARAPQPGRNISFAQEFPELLGHPYHSTSQAPILGKYIETGDHGMQSPKVPLYIQSSGVPETGHQTALPVPDAHFTRAVGLSDTRRSNKGAGDSMKMSEFQQIGPWFASKVANKVGLEAVPAQARLWGAMSKHTGVDTAIGAPKLELMANEIMRISRQYGISPERARDMVLQGELFNQGGAVNDNVTTATDRARSLASAT
jgi:Cell Wall Hydrolase